MKKGLFSSIILALCLAVLLAGVSSSANLCTKDRSFICSVLTFVFHVNAGATVIAPDKSYTRFYIHPHLTHHQELVFSIFHPPRTAS